MSKKTIFILSDALCRNYIYDFDMNNLKSLLEIPSTIHIKKIFPSTGYCEIVEYVTGQDAEQHMMFTQVNVLENWYEKKHPKILEFLSFIYQKNLLRKIPKVRGILKLLFNPIVEKLLTRVLDKSIVNVKYEIPYPFLYYMRPIESIYEYDSFDFGLNKNLFVYLRNHNISYDISDFVKHNKVNGSDLDRLERLKNKISNFQLADFTMLYIGYGEIAHFTGTNSEKFKLELQSYDRKLGDIVNILKNNYDDYEFIILGDHGMINVHHYHDIKSIFDKIIKDKYPNIRLFKDYIYFIDSTMFRVWFKNKEFIDGIEESLERELGNYLELDKKTKEYLNNFKPKFGDIILLLKPGSVFYPDFYNVKPNKGMHGYLNHYKGQQGTMIHITSDDRNGEVINELKLSSIKDYVLRIWENHEN